MVRKGRAGRYAAKIGAVTLPGQAKHFAGAVGEQVEAERYVKTLGLVTIMQPYYMEFAKRLMKIRKVTAGPVAQAEACAQWDLWNARELDGDVLDAIMLHYGFSACYPPPVPCPWAYEKKLTFSGNVSATDLTDFTVFVHLTGSNFDFSHAQANGQDVRFMADETCPDGGTPLCHEIEKWDQAGTDAVVWVKVPLIAGGVATGSVYMFYGNPAAGDGQDAAGTWSNGWAGVWHMKDDPDSSHMKDSSSGGSHLAKSGAGHPAEAAGVVGVGQLFNGSGDYAATGSRRSPLEPTGALTVLTWENLNAYGVTSAVACYTDRDNVAGYLMEINADGNIRFYVKTGDLYRLVANALHGLNAEKLLVGTYDGSLQKIYINGSLDKQDSNSGPIIYNSTIHELAIGAVMFSNSYVPYWLHGRMDEVRIASVARTADWIMAEYRSMSGSLLTYGAEEGT